MATQAAQIQENSDNAAQRLTELDALLPRELRGAELVVGQTDLCPALLLQARARRVRLFHGLEAWGLEAPTRLALAAPDGLRVLARGEDAAEHLGALAEPWLLCWFEGGRGWDALRYGQPCHWRGHHPEAPFPHSDVPWLVVLQRQPRRLALDAGGLLLEFDADAGALVAMPLFGADLPSVAATRAWREGLPPDVLERCRRWTRYLRRVPIDCRETFTLDAARDVVAIRQTFDSLAIEDDWRTPPEPLAPYPPFALLAAQQGFPVRLESPPDEEIATLHGPGGFRRNARSAAYELHGVLRYILEDETHPDAPASDAARRALERLRRKLERNPRLAVSSSGGYTRGLALAAAASAHALRYLAAAQQAPVRAVIAELLDRVLDPSHYVPLIRYATARDLEPVGEAVCQRLRDAYKVVQANLHGVWFGLAALGELERARAAWPLLRRWFHLPWQTQWATPLPARWEGLDIARALFDGTIGYARLAAHAGALDDFRFAAYLFAKVCAGWFAMEMMPRYHRAHPPWLFNTAADYLVWHPCRLNGYVLIANDHLLPHADPKIDSRGWASAFGRLTPTSARFWRDHLRERAGEVLGEMLPRCRPDWAEAGAPAIMRTGVLGASAEMLEAARPHDAAAEQAAATAPLRRRTYRLFQSTPALKALAAIEAGAQPHAERVVAADPSCAAPIEGAGRTADRADHAPVPVRIAPPSETGSFPLLYWPGIRAPRKPYAVLDERLDVLPFGLIATGDEGAPFVATDERHPNWCLTLFAHRKTPLESPPAPTTGRTNWALGRGIWCAKRFPFKEHKYAPDRDAWLRAFRQRRPDWQVLKAPHELTDGRGLRPGVEPWLRHAEPDPAYRHWIAIDLGAPRPVDEVVLAHDPAWIAAGFRIEAGPGDDYWSARLATDEPWTDLLAEATANRDAVSRHRFACRRTRWVRVSYTHPAPAGLEANRLVLWELELWGSEFF